MGSYRCAVLSEEKEILSEEGSIQLEGEFISSSPISMNRNLPFRVSRSSFGCLLLRSSAFLCGTPAHVCGSQRVPEPELCGPRPPRAGQGHLAAGWCPPQLPNGPSGPITFYPQPYRYCLQLHLSSRGGSGLSVDIYANISSSWLLERLHNVKNLRTHQSINNSSMNSSKVNITVRYISVHYNL